MHKDILPLEGVLLDEEIKLVVEHPRGEGCKALRGWYSVRCKDDESIMGFVAKGKMSEGKEHVP